MDKTTKLSTEPYKGVRDFYPEDWAIETYIFDVWRKTAESFGYVEYNASPLEPTELYKAKSGEEIINEQTYSFKDRGDRDVTLRPEMTPTVARMIAGQKRELKFPQRWFSIPNLFRYERPQRGRLREHYQLNCDIFGVAGVEAEVEMISLAYQIMKNFGIKDEQFEIRVNNREIINFLATKRGVREEDVFRIIKILDKIDKVPLEETSKKLDVYFNGESNDFINDLFKFTFENTDESKTNLYENKSVQQIGEIFNKLKKKGISNIKLKLELARGFDYYTGTVFEIYDKNPENPRALFGGGRYDNLLSIFGEEPVPTVGFGMGDVTIRDVLETYGLLPKLISTTKLLVCPLDESYFEEAQVLAQNIRKEGVNVAVNFSQKKVGDQITKADVEKIPFVIVLGADEVQNKTYKLKNLVTKEETIGGLEELVNKLK